MNPVTRRQFIQSSAALAALATVDRPQAAANDKIRVGVIGCRNRGPQVAEKMIDCGQFEIATLCDVDSAMLEKGMAALSDKVSTAPKQESDFRKVLEDKSVDAIINATPDHWHAFVTNMALDAGKHVYLEKPASYNIEEGKAMVAAQAKHKDRVVMVGTQQRSGPHFREAKQFIDEGGLGKVAFIRGSRVANRELVKKVPDGTPPPSLNYDMWLGPAPDRPYNESRIHYNWHFMFDTGTGEAGNWGAHWLDVLRWFMNLDHPSSASGLGGMWVTDDAKEFPDTLTVLFQFPELILAWEQRLWSNYGIGGGHGDGCEFNGAKGSLFINRSGWSFHPLEGEVVKHKGTELEIPHVTNFADAVRGHAQPAAPIAEGCKSATLGHLANITSRLNRRVEFDGATETITGDKEAAAMMSRESYRGPWQLKTIL